MAAKKAISAKQVSPAEDPGARMRRQAGYIRMLEFLVAAFTLSIGIYLETYPELYLLWVAVLLAYPLGSQALAFQLEKGGKRQEEASRVLVQIDAALIGATIAALHFSPAPALALLIMLHANAVTSGGLRPWIMNVLISVLGAAAGALVFGTAFLHPDQTPIVLLVMPLIGLAFYVATSSMYAHQQTALARAAQHEIVDQQQQAIELSRKLAKYLPPQIWGSLFSGKRDAKLETRRKRLTVFFSDIRGFSNISEDLPLDTLTRILNTYLDEMSRIALRYGGTIDKFIGDAIMIFFGDPVSKGSRDDAYNCVAMAIEMQRHMKLLRQRWAREGIEHKLEIRIGINSGYVTVGNFGSESRMDYTILGTDVNLASRLESAARPNHILISEGTWALVKDRVICRSLGKIEVKGFNRPIPVHEVQDLRGKASASESFQSVRTQGFSLYVDARKIRNFDQKKVLFTLAKSAALLAREEAVSQTLEVEGFSLFVDSGQVRERERQKIIEVMGQAAGQGKKKITTVTS